MKKKTARRKLRQVQRKIALHNLGLRRLTKREVKMIKECTSTLVKGEN